MSGKYSHIQGVINAKVVRLYFENKDKLLEYTDTLTEQQKQRARNHLNIVVKINKTKQY
jgi:hypothetical protein